MNKTLESRVKLRLGALGISQREAARRMGRAEGYIRDIFRRASKGKARVMSDSLPLLAQALETSEDYLLGKTDDPSRSIADMTEPREIPLMTIDSEGFSEAPRPKNMRPIHATLPVSEAAFAVIVSGASMTSTGGRSLPEGTLVIADPNLKPEPGKLVVAIDDDGLIVRVYYARRDPETGGEFAKLVPLNPAFDELEISARRRDAEIKGTVVEYRVAEQRAFG